ncbi:MAG: FixH family protein [Bacteroidota bacterium]
MSWGYKITFLYLGFVALITTMVVLSMRERVELVAADYYEQELNYQARIDAINHASELKEELTWRIDGTTLQLKFPEDLKDQKISGSIFFFRPSDSRLDKTMKIDPVISDTYAISLDKLQKGMYHMQISWKAANINYYKDGVIQIQ